MQDCKGAPGVHPTRLCLVCGPDSGRSGLHGNAWQHHALWQSLVTGIAALPGNAWTRETPHSDKLLYDLDQCPACGNTQSQAMLMGQSVQEVPQGTILH